MARQTRPSGFLDQLVADLENTGVITRRQQPTTNMEPQGAPPTPTPDSGGFDFGEPGASPTPAPTNTTQTPGGDSFNYYAPTTPKMPVYHPPTKTRAAYYSMPDGTTAGVRVHADGTTEPDVGGSGLPYFLANPESMGQVDVTTMPDAALTPGIVQNYGELTGLGGGGTANDAVGMGNLAVRQQELAEQIRHARMAEAQAAADAASQRFQAMMQARLQGAKYAITPSMAASGYFPGLSPTSALVRAGVADPLSFTPSYFNPASINAGPNPDQLSRDLAAIRGAGNG